MSMQPWPKLPLLNNRHSSEYKSIQEAVPNTTIDSGGAASMFFSSPKGIQIMRKVYRSKIDWSIWCMLLFAITIMIVCAIGSNWIISLPLISAIILFVVAISGTRYVIEGNTLIVYHFFRAHRIPIAKIKNATPAKGFLTGPALSSDRVSLRFTDRSVLKKLQTYGDITPP